MMRYKFVAVILIVLTVSVLGCSAKESTKTEAEIREEVKSELKEEVKAEVIKELTADDEKMLSSANVRNDSNFDLTHIEPFITSNLVFSDFTIEK
ncbi:hypothetical protein ACLIBH_05605 [Virgibacillus sp. W0430]|uniref:hypothetical protein n=1 Tax=Virgibacillus sp. W0430 TaxID=3391580 RepID=UPI003F453CD5